MNKTLSFVMFASIVSAALLCAGCWQREGAVKLASGVYLMYDGRAWSIAQDQSRSVSERDKPPQGGIVVVDNVAAVFRATGTQIAGKKSDGTYFFVTIPDASQDADVKSFATEAELREHCAGIGISGFQLIPPGKVPAQP